MEQTLITVFDLQRRAWEPVSREVVARDNVEDALIAALEPPTEEEAELLAEQLLEMGDAAVFQIAGHDRMAVVTDLPEGIDTTRPV